MRQVDHWLGLPAMGPFRKIMGADEAKIGEA